MSVPEQFSLKWNNHTSHLLGVFHSLLQSESLVDVTLSCDGQTIRAHKLVLSACSPYFKTLFEEHTESHPIVILKDVSYSELRSVVQFMYRGEIEVEQTDLDSLFSTAETLMIRGLTGSRLPGNDIEGKTEYNMTANNNKNNANDVSNDNIPGSNPLGSSTSTVSLSTATTTSTTDVSSQLASALAPLSSTAATTAVSSSQPAQESLQQDHQKHSSPKRKRQRRSPSASVTGSTNATTVASEGPNSTVDCESELAAAAGTNGIEEVSLASVKMEVEDHEDMNGGTLDTGAMALARSTGTVYLCRECGTSFNNQTQLQKHLNRIHTAATATDTLKSSASLLPALRTKDVLSPVPRHVVCDAGGGGVYRGHAHEVSHRVASQVTSTPSHQRLISHQGQLQESLSLPLLFGTQPFIVAAAAAVGLHTQMQFSGGSSSVSSPLDQNHTLRTRLLQSHNNTGNQSDSLDGGDIRLPLNLSASAAIDTTTAGTAASPSEPLDGPKIDDCHRDIREVSVLGVDNVVHRSNTPPQRPLSLLTASLTGAYSPGGKPKTINNNNEITSKNNASIGGKIPTAELEGNCNKTEIVGRSDEVGDHNVVASEIGFSTSPIFRPSSSSSSTGASTPNGNIPLFLGVETDHEASLEDADGSQVACKYCVRVFDSVGELMDHMSAHQGERPFRCEYCGKAFKFRHHLKDHHRIHTGERPFDCKICGKSFARSSILKTHCKIHRQEGRQRAVGSAVNTATDDDISQASPAPETDGETSSDQRPNYQFIDQQ